MLVKTTGNGLSVPSEILTEMRRLDEEQKRAKKRLDEFKKAMFDAMEKENLQSFDGGTFKVSYVEAQEYKDIDKAKLREFYPEIVEECSIIKTKKAFIRITWRDEDEGANETSPW